MEMQLNVQKLKQLRESKAWSQSQLADVAGISLRTVQRIEKSGIASPESVMSICSAYDIQTNDLIKKEEPSVDMPPTFLNVVRYKIDNMNIKATLVSFSVAFIIAFILTV
ncbi:MULTISPECIES: helix-turn-helix domain-containing protein [Pseudoalteromonas]|nr:MULTISPECIES: helix-turn-helix transcriptional regulator [Pseudoalteromonas]